MLRIKNKTFQPIQVPLRSMGQKTLDTLVIPARAELEIEEDSTTSMIDNLVAKGMLAVKKV